MRTTTGATLLATAVLLTACTDSPEQRTQAPPSEPTVTSGPASPSPSVALQRCENSDGGYALSYPADWFVATGTGIEPCTFFDDRPLSLEPRSEAVGVSIRVDVRDVPLPQARQDALSDGDQEAEDRSVGSRRAVRLTGVTTEEVLLPAGTRITTWLVQAAERTVVLTADDAGEGDYESAVAVLDEMVESLEVG